MTKCLNEIKLIGVVTTWPTTINEDPLGIKFKLCTFKTYFSKKKNEYVKQTEFHLVKAWTKDAEFVLNQVQKGERLFVDGEMHYYEKSFDDGRMLQKPEVIADNIIKLERANRNNSEGKEEENKEENNDNSDVQIA